MEDQYQSDAHIYISVVDYPSFSVLPHIQIVDALFHTIVRNLLPKFNSGTTELEAKRNDSHTLYPVSNICRIDRNTARFAHPTYEIHCRYRAVLPKDHSRRIAHTNANVPFGVNFSFAKKSPPLLLVSPVNVLCRQSTPADIFGIVNRTCRITENLNGTRCITNRYYLKREACSIEPNARPCIPPTIVCPHLRA